MKPLFSQLERAVDGLDISYRHRADGGCPVRLNKKTPAPCLWVKEEYKKKYEYAIEVFKATKI